MAQLENDTDKRKEYVNFHLTLKLKFEVKN